MESGQERLKEILAEAIARTDPSARAAYLAEACAGDTALRSKVEGLIAAYEKRGDFVEKTLTVPGLVQEGPGTMIGRYKLLQEIGEGAFGVVYMAEQTEPVHRMVALKIIKAGMDTRAVIARFEAERQALALMDHPNIAKIFDAGTTDAPASQPSTLNSQLSLGRPYFVMELVKGLPITTYADQYNLSTEERLQLFMQVCHGVQHAHQKGIIHRDLKPTNILVTMIDGQPVPKIIDFGVAKALGHKLTDKTLFTAFEQIIGTPAYMSPEQAELSGVDIDTRSDIYALGVLLYELLTGVTPFDQETLRQAALDEVRRIIRETEPPKPSTRLSELARRQKTEGAGQKSEVGGQWSVVSGQRWKEVHGDLDWIVMKALEKDRRRRYETASDLAEDLERHLRHQPVSAAAPGIAYRLGKFVRRHRLGVASAALVVIALGLGFSAALIGFVNAERERERAEGLLRRMEIERAREFFANDKSSEGLATLALLVREDPKNLALTEWLLNEMTQRSFPLPVREPLVHDSDVVCARFSPNGRRILTVTRSSSARVWDALSGRQLFAPLQHGVAREAAGEFTGGLFPMFAVFSPNSLRVATGASDNLARIWDAETGQPITPPLNHSNWVTALAFSPDGNWLATGCKNGTVLLWNATNGQPTRVRLQHADWVNFVEFSSDGKRLLTGADDYTARVWDLASGLPIGQPLQHADWVKDGSFSFDGRRVVTASADSTARLWDAQTGVPLSPPLRHGRTVVTAAFSPDGTRIVTTSFDHTARLWDGLTGQALGSPLKHQYMVRSAQFSPEGERVVTASEDGTARVWDSQTGEPLSEPIIHHGPVWSAAFSPDGRWVVTASADRTAQVWDVQEGRAIHHWVEDATDISQAFWSPDGKRLLALSSGIGVWDSCGASNLPGPAYRTKKAALTGSLSPDGKLLVITTADATALVWSVEDGRLASRPIRHLAQVRSARFGPDGLRIVTASDDGTARVWDARTSQPLGAALSHSEAVLSARFSPDGRQVLTAGADGQARLWDWRTGQQLGPGLLHPGPVVSAIFSPDGRRVLTICADFAVRIWDLPAGRMLETLIRHPARIYSACFSPNGRWVVTASADKTARVWEADTGAAVSDPLVHTAQVVAAEFSADGRRVLTASSDRTARLWDASTGLPISEPFRHRQKVASVQFSPGGTRILTGSADHSARIWEIVRAPVPAPKWLLALAEAVGGQRITDKRIFENVPATRFPQLRRAAENSPNNDIFASWARWFCMDRFFRPCAPSSAQNRAAFVRQLIEKSYCSGNVDQNLDSLRAAVMLDPLNPDIYAAWLFRVLTGAGPITPRQLAELDWKTRRMSVLFSHKYRYALRRPDHPALGGDVEATLALLEEVASQLKGLPSVDCWLARASLLERAGRPEAALRDYSRATEAQEAAGQDTWLYNAGSYRYSFLRRQGRYVEAQAAWLKLRDVPPRDPQAPPELIDLSALYNAVLDERWHLQEDYGADLRALPNGMISLSGVAFDIRALIQLRATNTFHPELHMNPFSGNISLSRKCRKLHFLHAADMPDAPGVEIGSYVVRYAGGERETIPIIYGKQVSSWVLDSPEAEAPVPVWQSTWRPGITLQLYHSVWTNPQPARMIESLNFTASPAAKAAPFLVALTAEP